MATEHHQVAWLREAESLGCGHGARPVFLDGDELRPEVHSPIYLAGLWEPDSCALVNPARLAWGLRAACERAGCASTTHPGRGPDPRRAGTGAPMVVATTHGRVQRRPGGTGHQRGAVTR